jgi:HPt (histidine-containing phosphotransfer) domain-containing protein
MVNNNYCLIETNSPTVNITSPNEPIKKQVPTNLPKSFTSNSIDYATLNSLKQYLDENQSTELFVEIVSIYLTETQERLDQLEQAIKCLDIKKIMLVAHNLKGTSNTLGVVKLASFCIELENLAPENISTETSNILKQIQKEFKQVYKVFSVVF